jgi:hypothetical protein
LGAERRSGQVWALLSFQLLHKWRGCCTLEPVASKGVAFCHVGAI